MRRSRTSLIIFCIAGIVLNVWMRSVITAQPSLNVHRRECEHLNFPFWQFHKYSSYDVKIHLALEKRVDACTNPLSLFLTFAFLWLPLTRRAHGDSLEWHRAEPEVRCSQWLPVLTRIKTLGGGGCFEDLPQHSSPRQLVRLGKFAS